MSEDKPNPPELASELAKMNREELLPVEKKLILWSLILGVVLLVALTWLSKVLFPS
jgi:hypothetical protein